MDSVASEHDAATILPPGLDISPCRVIPQLSGCLKIPCYTFSNLGEERHCDR